VSRPVLIGGLLLVLVVGSIGGLLLYSSLSRCMGGEREALSEFAHYEEPDYGPGPWADGCTVRYTTEASWEEVVGYYDEQLRQHGWEIEMVEVAYYPKETKNPNQRPPEVIAGDQLSELSDAPSSSEVLLLDVILTAERDGLGYELWYEPPWESDPDLPKDKALVTIWA
jgi:hypothetical protein